MMRERTTKMLIRGLPGAILAVALISWSPNKSVNSEAAQLPLSAELTLDPTPAHVGTDHITVTVRDSTGATVSGAAVHIAPSFATVAGGHAMAMPDMGRNAKTASATESADGAYHVDIELSKATHWIFVAHVSTAHTQITTTRGLDVGSRLAGLSN